MTGSGLSEVRKNRTLTELNFQTIRNSVQFVQLRLRGILISVAIFPHHFWMSSRIFCIMCIEIKLLLHILLNKISTLNLRLI